MSKRNNLKNLQIELAQVRKQHAKLAGEISKESLKIVLEIDTLMGELGNRLRALRLTAQLSQERVSTALGRKSNIMWRVEKRPQTIKLERYAKLLAIYGKTIGALQVIGHRPMKSVGMAAGR